MDAAAHQGRVAPTPSISKALKSALLSGDGLMEWLPIGVYVCDAEGHVAQYNRRAAELWGHAPEVGDGTTYHCGSLKWLSAEGEPLDAEATPMAELFRERAAIRDRELMIERPDGSRISVLANLDPLYDDAGKFVGGVNCFQDISARKAAERTLKVREEWYLSLLEALPAAIYTTDARGHLTFFNQAAAALAGRLPALGTDEWCVSWRLFAPNGAPLPHDECPMAVALKTGKPVRGTEKVAERPDGTRIPILPFPTPLHDRAGNMIGAVNMLVDISDRKRAEEQKTLLLRELAHRVNNTFAVILAITQQSLATATSPEAFAETFTARLQSLAQAHNLLLAQDWAGADLAELVRGQVAPFTTEGDERFRIAGPRVMLGPGQVIALGAVLHELATNACRYGALSGPLGKVDLGWEVADGDGGEHVRIVWAEHEGPRVKEPAKRGLGSRIIQRGLPNATIDLRFEPRGVVCTIDLLLDRRKARTGEDWAPSHRPDADAV